MISAIAFMGWNIAAEAASGAPVPPRKPSLTTISQPAGALPLPKAKPDMAGSVVASVVTPEASVALEKEKPAPAYNYAAYDFSRPLSSRDKKLYEDIFAAQSAGKFAEADALIEKLRDTRLLGHVLEQRYRHADYKTSFAELKTWLAHYSDLPSADDMYDLRKSAVRPEIKAF
ncbi:MAG: hypothetical protein LRY54_02650 [Alphaproteobacteria bacterium]|nr:hypothetical protein [Alphaproteobacteria bacterium]